MTGPRDAWPGLDLAEWADTYATVHLWTQMLGKTRLALSPPENHWWHTALVPTAHGLATPPMPSRGRMIEIELDFTDDRLRARSSDGATREMPLRAEPVRDTWASYRTLLDELGCDVAFHAIPVELPDPTPFASDVTHASYDADAVRRCHRAMLRVHEAFLAFRGDYLGKCSPSHFWWGAYDLACTRFSGRRAPTHPGGVPNLADHVVREAYSHECFSVGWWPGSFGGAVAEPALYAYAYPEPDGFSTGRVEPAAAYYHADLREWILPWEAVRAARDPRRDVDAFLVTTYALAADRGGWDRAALERRRSG